MIKQKVRREFWWLENWQLAEQEAWLEEMSSQGWHLLKTGIGRATFEQGEPQNYRYRCDVFPADNWSEQERLTLYQEVGWEHVAQRGLVQIFRAPADKSIPEIHTDPGEHLRNLRRLLPGRLGEVSFPFILLAILAIAGSLSTAEALLASDLMFMISIVFLLGWAVLNIGALLQLRRYMRSIRRRQPPTHSIDWRKQKRRRQVSGALVALVFVLTWGHKVAGMVSETPDFPPIPDVDLPVVRLSQVIGDSWYASSVVNSQGYFEGRGDVFNYFRQEGGLLVPEQYSLAESVKLPVNATEADSMYFHCDAYRAISPNIARVLASSLAKRRPFYPYRSNLPLIAAADSHGFDGLWVLDQDNQKDAIAWQGDWVYYISYNGSESLDQVLGALQDQQD